MWFIKKDGATIFEGPEKINLDHSKIQNVLGCCFDNEQLNSKFLELNNFHIEANNILKEIRPDLEELIRFLKAGGLIQGKCDLGY